MKKAEEHIMPYQLFGQRGAATVVESSWKAQRRGAARENSRAETVPFASVAPQRGC